MPAGRRFRLAAAAVLAIVVGNLALGQDLDPARQREAQKKVQAQIDEAARRSVATLNAMKFLRLSPSQEQETLKEVAENLRGLSDDQIKGILNHLDAAVKAPDATTATQAQREAYAKHKQVIERLRELTLKMNAIRSLEEAATRLEAAANNQLELATNSTVAAQPQAAPRRFGGRGGPVVSDKDTAADDQSKLRAETASIAKQLGGLVPHLNPEQKERLEKANATARGQKLASEMDKTVRDLQRGGSFDDAAERQRRHAKELQDLAAALRGPVDLRKAAEKIDAAIAAQQKVNDDTTKKPEEQRDFRAARNDPRQEKANKLANEQAKAEFETRDARKALEQAAPEIAEKVKPAETAQWKAEDLLRKQELANAKEPQEKALDALKEAKAEVEKKIAAENKAKSDPLEAVKQAAEKVEKLIEEQKAANDKTKEAAKNDNKNLDEAKQAQKDVGDKTDALKDAPLPPNPEFKNALDKAANEQKQASNKLDNQKPDAAKPNQEKALKNLEDAKKALDKQAAEIEKRRDEIAKLEMAKDKLDMLAQEQKKVADDAKTAANDPKKQDPKDVADKQGELNPPTKEAGMELKDIAPKAAEKVNEASEKQQGAKDDLGMKNDPKAGAEKANDAAKKLDEAAKEVGKQLAEKRGMEANDQQALQNPQNMPNQQQQANADQMNAQKEIQKAIEQAQKAEQKANEASQKLAQQPMNKDGKQPMGEMGEKGQKQPNLADLQKQLAEKAGDAKQNDAQKDGNEAAKALEKGDLNEAIQKQQAALDKLQKAAKGEPMPGEKGEKGMGEKGMGDPKAGELAMEQQQLLDATKAVQQSKEANNAAQAAVQQAQAKVPGAVQEQLGKANEQLQQAGEKLGMGEPKQAGMNQQQAQDALQQALDALNSAMAQAQGMQPGMGMMPGMGEMANNGMEPGMQPGMQPGQQPGQKGMQPGQKGMQPGQPMPGQPPMPGDEKGMEGDQDGPEKLKKDSANPKAAAGGEGSFIHLRNKEREKVQQSVEAQFPAEFRELIKQYNINIKNNKPGMPSPAPAGR